MTPMFHIKDSLLPKRLYRIKNQNRQEEIIEMKQEDLVSLNKFKQKVEGLGNYIWLATEKELTKLKMFLYEQTETALGGDPAGLAAARLLRLRQRLLRRRVASGGRVRHCAAQGGQLLPARVQRPSTGTMPSCSSSNGGLSIPTIIIYPCGRLPTS